MRRSLLLVGLVLAGCPPQTIEKKPPVGQFYFPSGIVHVDRPPLPDGGSPEGTLYVASANLDRRFDFGAVMAVDLDRIGLPPFGAPVAGGVARQITDLKLTDSSTVLIASFAGEMAALPIDGGVRLFVPTRSELHRLYAINAPTPLAEGQTATLECFKPEQADAGVEQNCTETGLSFVANEKSETGIPRAPSPIGVAISPSREVWVTSLQQADTPRLSTLLPRGYVVHVNGDNPVIDNDEDGGSSFVNVGTGATSSIVVGDRFAYATGRLYASAVPAQLLRAIDTTSFATYSMALESSFTAFESRGAALSSDQKRLYLIAQAPDTLVVASVNDAAIPDVRVQRSVPLPEGPTLITAIPRAGKSDLVVISCTDSGVVVFYDDDVGNLVGQVAGVGLQPFAIAVNKLTSPVDPAGAARLFLTNFTDGRVTVIDVPELSRPASARIVAFLGATQLCITRGANERSCDGGTQ